MKILLVNKFFYQKGGSETVFFTTKKLLEKAGNQVVVFSMKDDKNFDSKYAKYFVNHIDFTNKKNFLKKVGHYIYSFEAKRKIKKLLQDEKPDIVHLHNISHQLTPSILSPIKKMKIPVVQTLHDYQLICPNYKLYTQDRVCEKCKKCKFYNAVRYKCVQDSFFASLLAAKELYWQRIFKYYKEKVDLFISPSHFLKDKFVDWGFKKTIQVVPNSLDIKKIKPNFNHEDYIVCVSRFSKEKGLLTLVEAVKDLPNVKLKIVGDGPLFEQISLYLQDYQINNIELLGRLPLKETYKVIENSKFLVIPSQWYENYPLVVLEAMAYGKPVLASDLGGLTEMINEDVSGWLFQAGNIKALKEKMQNLYNQDDLIISLGKKARQQVEKNNSNEVYLNNLLRIYDKLINSDSELG